MLVLAVPTLNFWVPRDSPAALPDYLVPLLGKYLCYALLALSLDLIWGYAAILSLGHGAFFALGGYCMGMYLMLQIGKARPEARAPRVLVSSAGKRWHGLRLRLRGATLEREETARPALDE